MRGGSTWAPRGRFPEWLGQEVGLLGQRPLEYSSIRFLRWGFLPGTAPPAPTLVGFLSLAHSLRLHNFPHWGWECGRPCPWPGVQGSALVEPYLYCCKGSWHLLFHTKRALGVPPP